jgi:hypothetical protein
MPKKLFENSLLSPYRLLFGWLGATYWVRTPTSWDGKSYISGLADGRLSTAYAQVYPDVLPAFSRAAEAGAG